MRFLCLAIGDPFPTVTWSFNGEMISFDDHRYSIGTTGEEYGSLRIINIVFSDRGEYTCTYNNTHGTVIAAATLTVQGK